MFVSLGASSSVTLRSNTPSETRLASWAGTGASAQRRGFLSTCLRSFATAS